MIINNLFCFLDNISETLFLYYAFYHHASQSMDETTTHHYSNVVLKSELSILAIASSDIYCKNESDTSTEANEAFLKRQPQLLCVFDTHHGNELRTNAAINCLPESHAKSFTSAIITCRVPVRAMHHRLTQVKVIQRNKNQHRSKVSGPIAVVTKEDNREQTLNASYGLH